MFPNEVLVAPEDKKKIMANINEICEILEKIQALIKILYSSTSAFKIIADKKTKIIN